jgi:Fe-S cluster assembly iron-binding protein IscA
MLQLDQKTITELQETGVSKLKVFFYSGWCSGTKINMETEFEVTSELQELESSYSFKLYVPKTDTKQLENARITKTVKADHTGQAKVRYIFTSEEVEERCGCGTSFAFEKPAPKVNLMKLQMLRQNFKNKNS